MTKDKKKPYRKSEYKKPVDFKKYLLLASGLGLGAYGSKKLYDLYKKSKTIPLQIDLPKELYSEDHIKEQVKLQDELEKRLKEEEKQRLKEEEKQRKKYREEEQIKSIKLIDYAHLLLTEMAKTKHKIKEVDELIKYSLLKNPNIKWLVKETCSLYNKIYKELYDECNKPYIESQRDCVIRTLKKRNINTSKTNAALLYLGC